MISWLKLNNVNRDHIWLHRYHIWLKKFVKHFKCLDVALWCFYKKIWFLEDIIHSERASEVFRVTFTMIEDNIQLEKCKNLTYLEYF